MAASFILAAFTLFASGASAGAIPMQATPAATAAATPVGGGSGKLSFLASDKIYVIDADGSNLRRLTANPFEHVFSSFLVAWSPDRTAIAYSSTRSEPAIYQIWVMRADGSDLHRLTTGTYDTGPEWSPDGKRIAYLSAGYRLNVIDVDGKNRLRLTTDQGSPIITRYEWSPDGRQIAYDFCCTGGSNIYVVDADGKNAQRLTDDGSSLEPAWSPDGKRIAFRHVSEGIFILDVETRRRSALPIDRDRVIGPDRVYFEPIWSPDGKYIAVAYFSGLVGVSEYRIAVVDVSDPANITVRILRPGGLFADDLTWSPDSKYLAFVAFTGRPEVAVVGLYIMAVDGSGLRRLTAAGIVPFKPVWVP